MRLTTPSGERIEYVGIQLAPEEYDNGNDLIEGVNTKDSKVDCEFPDDGVEELTPLEELHPIDDDYPVRIIERARGTLKGRVLNVCKVQWNNQSEEDATWENENQIKIDFPYLFEM